MKPKDKAIELIKKMQDIEGLEFEMAKQCALVAVEEMIKFAHYTKYWKQVQSEINNTFAV